MQPRLQPASEVRDSALRRLRRLTLVATAAGTALSGAFAGLAATAVPGRKPAPSSPPSPSAQTGSLVLPSARRSRRTTTAHRTHTATTKAPAKTATAAAPPAASAPPPAPTPTPAPSPPPVPPAPTPAPPVVVSGGS